MNNKQARRLRDIAFLISPDGTSTVTKTGYNFIIKGKPSGRYSTTYLTGTRATYQALKKQFNAVPRNERATFLEAMEAL